MKTFFLIASLAISLQLSAQDNLMFDTSKVNANTKLIGRYPQYDKQKTHKYLNFIIDDPATIKKVMATLTLGKEGENTMEDPDFRVELIQDFEDIKTWIISPGLKSAHYNGQAYEFDVDKLRVLAKKYPFDYKFEKIPFKSNDEFKQYLSKQKENKTFLFDYPPQFKYEGSFEIRFPRNETFSSPKAISDYLEPKIKKIVAEDEYTIAYFLNERNMKDQTQFTMTIRGSKKLYESLDLENLKKENWKATVEEGWFFYRIKP